MRVQAGAKPVDEGDCAQVQVCRVSLICTGAAGLQVCCTTRRKIRSAAGSSECVWALTAPIGALAGGETHGHTADGERAAVIGWAGLFIKLYAEFGFSSLIRLIASLQREILSKKAAQPPKRLRGQLPNL